MTPLRRDDAVGLFAWHTPWVDGSLSLRGASADLADNHFRRFSLKMGCTSSLQRNANNLQTKCKQFAYYDKMHNRFAFITFALIQMNKFYHMPAKSSFEVSFLNA